jgi:hypothetical protein
MRFVNGYVHAEQLVLGLRAIRRGLRGELAMRPYFRRGEDGQITWPDEKISTEGRGSDTWTLGPIRQTVLGFA